MHAHTCCLIRHSRSAAPARRTRSTSPPLPCQQSSWQAQRGYTSDGAALDASRDVLSINPTVIRCTEEHFVAPAWE